MLLGMQLLKTAKYMPERKPSSDGPIREYSTESACRFRAAYQSHTEFTNTMPTATISSGAYNETRTCSTNWSRASRSHSLRAIVLTCVSPEQLVEILDIAEDGIITVDARQVIVLFNRGAAKIFGYTPEEEIVGQPLELLLPVRFREPHRGQMEGFARSPAPARADGRTP